MAVFSELGATHALIFAMGAVAYMWFWRGGPAHAWVGVWCLASLFFQFTRLAQPSSEVPEVSLLATRTQFGAAGVSATFEDCMKNGRPVDREFALTTHWGRDVRVRTHIAPLRDRRGRAR